MNPWRATRTSASRPSRASVVVGVLAAIGAVVPGPSLAAARPIASLRLPTVVDVGAYIPVTYRATGVRAHSQVLLQLQEDASGWWRTLMRLAPSRAGSAELQARELGEYQVRLLVLGSRHRVLAQRVATFDVFGTVSLATLFAGYNGFVDTPYGHEGAYPTATGTFDYAIGLPEYGNFSSDHINPEPVSGPQNHCRSIHLDFLPGAQDGAGQSHPSGYVGTVTVVQAALAPVSASAGYESVGHLDAELEPGQSWAIQFTDTGMEGYTPDLFGFYLNGSASCDRDTPLY